MSLCLSVGVNDSIRIEPMTTCDVCGSIGIESVNFIRVCVCLVSFICVGTFAGAIFGNPVLYYIQLWYSGVCSAFFN